MSSGETPRLEMYICEPSVGIDGGERRRGQDKGSREEGTGEDRRGPRTEPWDTLNLRGWGDKILCMSVFVSCFSIFHWNASSVRAVTFCVCGPVLATQ